MTKHKEKFNLIFMEEYYLNDRKRIVLNQIINSYLSEGLPIGSKTLSTKTDETVSSSSLRNVMAELETMGKEFVKFLQSQKMIKFLDVGLFH